MTTSITEHLHHCATCARTTAHGVCIDDVHMQCGVCGAIVPKPNTSTCTCRIVGHLVLHQAPWPVLLVCHADRHDSDNSDDAACRINCSQPLGHPKSLGQATGQQQMIYVSSQQSPAARVTTLMHEIGHIINVLSGGEWAQECAADAIASLLRDLGAHNAAPIRVLIDAMCNAKSEVRHEGN